MKNINVNLKKEIENYSENDEIKKIALSILEELNEGRNDKSIEMSVEREINNLVK